MNEVTVPVQEENKTAETSETPDSQKETSAQGLLADATKKDETPASETTPETDPNKTEGSETIAERPDYIAEQFWDAEKGVPKVEEMSKGYNNLRTEFNKVQEQKGEKAPEKAEDYLIDYQPPVRSRPTGDQKEGDVLDRFGDLDAEDPAFVAMAKAAKSANINQKQFNDMMQVAMEELHPILPEPFDAEKEKALLGEGADNIIQTNRDWIDTLMRNGVLNEDEFNLLLAYGGTALGVQLTNKLRLNSGEKPIPVKLTGNANTGRKTPDECQAMMADERYHADGSVGDTYRAEVDKAFADTYGTKSE
jgi:hypothetical protein